MPISQEQQDFQDLLTVNVNPLVDNLPVTSQVQILPLNKLSWEYFEMLCCRLVNEEPNIVNTPYRYGVQGNDQKGIDIVAIKNVDSQSQTWCFQCKRYQNFNKADLSSAIHALEHEAEKYIICITARATAEMRDIVRNHQLDIEIWDIEDISSKLKTKSHLVYDFFGKEWETRFCIPSPSTNIFSILHGRIFDPTGRTVENAEVRSIINGKTNGRCYSSINGEFQLDLTDQANDIGLIVKKEDPVHGMLNLSTLLKWKDISSGSINIHLEKETKITGRVNRCGTSEPVNEATIIIEFLDESIASTRSNLSGEFTLSTPNGYNVEYNLEIQAKGFISARMPINIPLKSTAITLGLARECKQPICETIVVANICDDMKIEFVYIPDGPYLKGEPNSVIERITSEYYISRFPITCTQYSYYLQHNPNIQLPIGWNSTQPPYAQENHPITGITYDEARDFCLWLSSISKLDFVLPNEDEWEKAARGVVDDRRFPWGNHDDNIDKYCNSVESSQMKPTHVNRFPLGKSPFGVWDMAGNVWEWTETEISGQFVLKGGSAFDTVEDVACYARRLAHRNRRDRLFGFRVLRKGQF
ncbi:MAG: SUMF1/EgtB/PvdO family nonheme iron enzyme [Caldilineaceae bacterium]